MKIGIIGAAGRMGTTLLKQVLDTENTTLLGAVEHSGHAALGQDIGPLIGQTNLGITVSEDKETLIKAADAIIDFTNPANSLACAALAAKYQTVHVIGTTGLDKEQEATLSTYAKDTHIIYASNMSIGVNLVAKLVEKVASILDEQYDIEIIEMHHKHKVDAPSGTALTLGKAAAKGRKKPFDTISVLSREGNTGPRKSGDIGFATLRGGNVVGDHTVIFASEGDRIEITHKASDRSIYAKGAIRACLWAQTQPPGLYHIQDTLQ